MLEHFSTLATLLRERLPSLNWIDLDKGQLDNPTQYNSLLVPALLVRYGPIDWQEMGMHTQVGSGSVTLKLVFRLTSQTHDTDPLLHESAAQLELAADLHRAAISTPGLQQRASSNIYQADTLYVVEQTYQAQFTDGDKPVFQTVPVFINPYLYKPNQL